MLQSQSQKLQTHIASGPDDPAMQVLHHRAAAAAGRLPDEILFCEPGKLRMKLSGALLQADARPHLRARTAFRALGTLVQQQLLLLRAAAGEAHVVEAGAE